MHRFQVLIYFLILFCLNLLPKSIDAKNCMIREEKAFCEGDRVFFPYPKSEEQYFGIIEKVDPEIRNGNHQGNMWVRLKDGTVLTDDNGYHTYFHFAELLECSVFSGQKVCVGQTVPVMRDFGNRDSLGYMKVIAIAPNRPSEGYRMYGPTKVWSGEIVLARANKIPMVSGIVPKFPELQFGDPFPNAYGKSEKIILFDVEEKDYALESEGTDHLIWYTANKLRIRFNQIKEYPIQWQERLEETTDCFIDSCAKDVLLWRASLHLRTECDLIVFGNKKSSTRDTTYEIEYFESNFEFRKYLGNHFLGRDIYWPIPRKTAKALVIAKTICISTETKESK